jgi:hypothetical protein
VVIKENQQSFNDLSQIVALAGNEVRLKNNLPFRTGK